MSGFTENVRDFASAFEGKNGYIPKGPSGPDDGGDDMKARVDRLEAVTTQIGMDMSYMKGRIEDAPSKDWINEKLGRQTTILLTVIGLGLAALAVVIAAVALK